MSKPRRKSTNWPAPAPPAEIPPPHPTEPCYVCGHADYHAVPGGWACVTCHPAPGYVAPIRPLDIRHAAILRWGDRHGYPALVLTSYVRLVPGVDAWRHGLMVADGAVLSLIRAAIAAPTPPGEDHP